MNWKSIEPIGRTEEKGKRSVWMEMARSNSLIGGSLVNRNIKSVLEQRFACRWNSIGVFYITFIRVYRKIEKDRRRKSLGFQRFEDVSPGLFFLLLGWRTVKWILSAARWKIYDKTCDRRVSPCLMDYSTLLSNTHFVTLVSHKGRKKERESFKNQLM